MSTPLQTLPLKKTIFIKSKQTSYILSSDYNFYVIFYILQILPTFFKSALTLLRVCAGLISTSIYIMKV